LSALHYASFKGDIEALRLLVGFGANIELLNTSGLSALHIAAQGDQPISLAYLLSIGLDLNQIEAKGGTTLHWACYLGCENALNFLISRMKPLINLPDNVIRRNHQTFVSSLLFILHFFKICFLFLHLRKV